MNPIWPQIAGIVVSHRPQPLSDLVRDLPDLGR